ncbi:BatA domain-containing protein [Flavobacterium granuli]|uniref:Membrane protein (TIGR02226 family) n=1 Tax=Flavobacterium granuli TaxID=280093 RepID=A0A1M5I9V6_9FLAO|nr:BatA domain-containing protein [Flavobacterium granuli]PRZ27869.1 putative membrane protein (TIGR02226 family) [Flavobacterium granuli]SHG25041.1 N-terminal double-transmembrane domain-containing protein [Flavobacterium granuli]
MQFKHPEILYFLFLLIVPILVHLFQFRRFKKEYFTNVRFLSALSVQTRKSSKIKKWLLLGSRLLFMLFLILAFAQPFFEAKDNSNATNEMYIILDNSFSMQAKGKKGELLRRSVQELLENTPENATFSLITNSETYWNTDIKSIQNSLQNLKYSALPFQLDQLMAKVKSHKSAFKKDIVIITDAVGLDKKQLKNNDKNELTYFIIPKAEQKNNVAIDSVSIHETLENFYEINVELSNYGDDFKPIPIAIYNGNKLIAKTLVQFDTKKKSQFFTIPKQDFHGSVSITDNSLEYDNTLYFSISKTKKVNIISIGEAEKSNFLSRIYTADEFNFSNSTLASLDYNSLEKQDVILLNEIDEIPQALQITLKSFVEKGGNLVFIPSSKNTVANINSFLSHFGTAQFKPLKNVEKLISKINFNHPLFASVFENKISNFQYPKTNASFEIAASGPAALYNDDQSPFLTALSKPASTVYIFSAPINSINSNFQQSPLIVPVFYKIAMSNQKNAVTALTIGNQQAFFTDVLLSKDAVLSVRNATEQFIPVQQILNNKVKLIFNDYPLQAGNFEIYNQKTPVENISFNYSRTESNWADANENILSDYKIIDSIATVFNTIETERTDNQIWKWFVIFALLFLIIEMAILKFLK